MARQSGSLIANGGRFAPSPNAAIGNVIESGQLGFGPILKNLDGNTPPVFLPMQLVVLHVPTFFNYIQNGPAIFKALFELHLQQMDGFDPQYQMEVEGTPVGRDGQTMDVPMRQTRNKINPTCTWSEKIGNVIYNFGRLWMNAMRDIDTQASSMAGIIPAGTTLPPLVASMYAADILLIQYDTTMRPDNIIDALAITNFFPTDIGSPGYTLNQQQNTRPERQFTFTGVLQHNNNTIALAKNVATLLNLHTVNFQDAHPIADAIETEIRNEGIERQVSQILSTFRNQNQ